MYLAQYICYYLKDENMYEKWLDELPETKIYLCSCVFLDFSYFLVLSALKHDMCILS